MVEPARPVEIERRGAPIHLVFGEHNPAFPDTLSYLDNAIGNALRRTTSGNVVVVVEDRYALAAEVEIIEQFVAEGELPSIMYATVQFGKDYGRFPRVNNRQDARKVRTILDKTDAFRQRELAILDKYSQTGRIRLLWEAKPNEEVQAEIEAGTYNTRERLETALHTVFESVTAGNFDEGLTTFQPTVEELALDVRKRNDRLATRIGVTAEEPDVAAVVGYIGSAHSRIRRILTQRGYLVSSEFPGKENGSQVWGTFHDAIRQREFFPDREPSEVGWYRLMLGVTIEDCINLMAFERERRTGATMSKQEIIRFARAALVALHDMDTTRQFERSVRERGDFLEALMHLSEE